MKRNRAIFLPKPEENAVEQDLDTINKIEKKYNFYCKHYSKILQTDTEFPDDDFNSPRKNKGAFSMISPQSSFRKLSRQKDVTPVKDPIPYNKNEGFRIVLKSSARNQNLERNREKLKEIVENSNKTQETEPMNDIEAVKDNLHQVYEEIYRDGTMNENRKNLHDFFGNAMIAAFLESLIKVAVENSRLILEEKSIEKEKSFAISSGLAKNFNISYAILQSFSSIEEKNRYIISCMQKNIEMLLEKWQQKHSHREYLNIVEDEKLKSRKIKMEASIKDQFSWLQVKSHFEFLQKSLRGLLIEKLNYFENQEKIISTLKLNRISRNTNNSNINTPYLMREKRLTLTTPYLTITPHMVTSAFLDKIPVMTTGDILKKINSESMHLSQSIMNKSKTFNNNDSSYFADSRQNDKNLESSFEKISSNYLLSSSSNPSFFQWNKNREDCFKETRSRAMTNHVKEVKVSNFYQLGFSPMMQEINQDSKKMKQRDLKLQRFAEGDALCSEDLKYIVDTSELLNSCVDREFLQEAINVIDENVIENLELYLAETILLNYHEIKSVIRESRMKYLKEKNNEFARESEQKEEELKRRQSIEKKKEERKRVVKMYNVICQKMENNGKFVRGAVNIKEKKKNGFTEEIKRRTFHPPSKIMSTNSYSKNDFYDEQKYEKIMKENEEISKKFKLSIHSPQVLKHPTNFVNFYSGGPSICPLPEKEIKEISFSKEEISKIIKIQSHWRKFRTKKHFKHEKTQNFLKKLRIALPNHSALQKCLKSPDNNPIRRAFGSPPKATTTPSERTPLMVKFSDKSQMSTLFPSSTNPSKRFFNNDQELVKSPVKTQKLFDALKKNNFREISDFELESRHVNKRDENGNVPLYYAAKMANIDFCNFLILAGARVNEPCENKDTPMHMACASNKFDLIMLFLENGGSLVIKNEKGVTGLELLNSLNLRKLELLKDEEGKIGDNRGEKLDVMFRSLRKRDSPQPKEKKAPVIKVKSVAHPKEFMFRSERMKSEQIKSPRKDLLNLRAKGIIKESGESLVVDSDELNQKDSVKSKEFNFTAGSPNNSSRIVNEISPIYGEKQFLFNPQKNKTRENQMYMSSRSKYNNFQVKEPYTTKASSFKQGENLMFLSYRANDKLKGVNENRRKITDFRNHQQKEEESFINHNQDSLLRIMRGKSSKEELAINSFEPKMGNPDNFEEEAGKKKRMLSFITEGNQGSENGRGSVEKKDGYFMKRLKKISINHN